MPRLEIEGIKDFYYAGEEIRGTAVLSDIMGMKIRGVFIELYYQAIVIVGGGDKKHRHVDRVDVYQERVEGEKVYEIDVIRYEFQIQIPSDAPPSIAYEEDRRVEWILKVKVDIPYRPDLVKTLKLTIYNSVKPEDLFTIDKVRVENSYARLEVDKNIYEYNETITGKFMLYNTPSNLRKVDICLCTHLEIKIEDILFTHNYTSNYEIVCRSYRIDELATNREYSFKLERDAKSSWAITYVSPKIRVTTYMLLRFDIRFMKDITLEAPVTIYHSVKEKPETKPIPTKESIENQLLREITEIMRDGKTRDIVDIRFALDFKYDTDEVIKACDELVDKGILEVVEEGELLKKYRIKKSIKA